MDDIISSESETECDDPVHVFYCDRPEWSDMKPIAQDDGQNPVVQIAYSNKFRDIYDYFRAVLEKNEISERALSLTADAIRENSANYSVWSYRRTLLIQLKKDLTNELAFISKIIARNLKNYQVWYHRQKIVLQSRDASQELDFTARMLKRDSKNYHAWQHRQWVLREFKLWSDELVFVDSLIAEDPKNNSAWNQRYFVIANTSGFSEDVILREYNYAIKYLSKDNESPFNYLRGILVQSGTPLHQYQNLTSLFESLHRTNENKSRFTAAFLLEIYASKIREDETTNRGNDQLLSTLLEICDDLATKEDTVREKYWTFQKKTYIEQFSVNN